MRWTRCALIVILTFWVGCTRDSLVDGEPPQTVIDVDSLVFVQVALGQTDTQTLTIRNVGRGDLVIERIDLVETTDDDEAGLEFTRGEGWVESAIVATDGELPLEVAYTPGDRFRDEGYIELRTNDPGYDDGVVRIPLETPLLAPQLFTRDSVRFPRVPPVDRHTRNTFWKEVDLQNVGHVPLEVKDIVVSPMDGPFHVEFAEADSKNGGGVSAVAPGESLPLRVYFNPVDDEPSDGELIIYSDDPQSPEHVVTLAGNSGAPCLKLSDEDEIDFGRGAVGFASHRTLVLENCSASSDLVVRDVSPCTFGEDGVCDPEDPTFTVKPDTWPGELPDDVAVIGPQETSMVVLSYAPPALVESTGELTIASNDPARPELTIPIVGHGTNNACPTAVAEARLVESDRWQSEINTVPLKTLRFRGSNSVDPDGTIARYEWVIVERPTNSQARFSPSAHGPETALFLDLAGNYLVELLVFDDEGVRNCGDQAMVAIRATPDDDIHVQLVWQTPNDVDETDTSGSDVDLHFLHPLGEWNRAPYDIFWANPTADWGAPGPYDDPRLDIDDTDGGGPENINLSEPESGATYTVGVHYYDDSGYGAAYATVRIFIRGEKRFEQRDVYLPRPDAFWSVATITWPSTEIVALSDEAVGGFP